MPEDDPFADDGQLGPPLPPDDRLWRHPSELAWTPLDDPSSPLPSTGSTGSTGSAGSVGSAPPRVWTVAVGAALSGAVLALSVVALTGGLGGRSAEQVLEPVPTSAVRPALVGPERAVHGLAADVRASIVQVDAVAPDGSRRALGSGVVLRADGTVVTNAHVVLGVGQVALVRADGTAVPATVVGSDLLTDVAVVVADRGAHEWRPAVLGSAAALEVGDATVAVGSTGSIAGSVRGLSRRAEIGDVVLHGLVETDARVTGASSGGALCDESGVVVGLTTVVGDVGFAVPADVALSIADDLLSGGVRHAWLGIRGGDADDAGVVVAGVDGPAAAAGIVPGDVIVAFDDRPVRSMSDLVLALRSRAPGDMVRVELDRAGAPVVVDVTLAERP